MHAVYDPNSYTSDENTLLPTPRPSTIEPPYLPAYHLSVPHHRTIHQPIFHPQQVFFNRLVRLLPRHSFASLGLRNEQTVFGVNDDDVGGAGAGKVDYGGWTDHFDIDECTLLVVTASDLSVRLAAACEDMKSMKRPNGRDRRSFRITKTRT